MSDPQQPDAASTPPEGTPPSSTPDPGQPQTDQPHAGSAPADQPHSDSSDVPPVPPATSPPPAYGAQPGDGAPQPPYGEQPQPPYGQPASAQPAGAQPPYGRPPYGQAGGAQPPYGQPGVGQPYGQAGGAQPPYGQAGGAQPPYGQAGYGQPPYGQAPYAQPYGQAPSSVPSGPVTRNILGVVGLAIAAVGTILGCIPGIQFLGWLLLPVGFILGLIGVFQKNKTKWESITAMVVAVVGSMISAIIAVVLFFATVSSSIADNPWSDGYPDSPATAAPIDPPAAAEVMPFSTPIAGDQWEVRLDNLTTDAEALVTEASPINVPAPAGEQWIILDLTATYVGTGDTVSGLVQVEYVTADGTGIFSWENFTAGIEPMFGLKSVGPGESDSGKLVFLVPDSLDGTFRVTPGVLANPVELALP
ncbi:MULTISPECIES: hypothetical protein [unclassified Microbacterium]|uniref:hypothetical protein n=1 Tax=unclassified Microbacterium TaxID=2609290 RepID=UPI003863800C